MVSHQCCRLLHIRPLQPCHDWRSEVHALHYANQPLRNSITPHDPAENIDEYGSNFGVAGDEIESLFDRLRSGASAHIEEIRRLAPV